MAAIAIVLAANANGASAEGRAGAMPIHIELDLVQMASYHDAAPARAAGSGVHSPVPRTGCAKGLDSQWKQQRPLTRVSLAAGSVSSAGLFRAV
jgi:hypothetical protein